MLSAHVLKFGGEARLLRNYDDESGSSTGNFSFSSSLTQSPNPNAARSTAGNCMATFLLGAGSGSMPIQSKNSAAVSQYCALHLQDNWNATRKLTLNLGLRWDVDMPRTAGYNRMSTFSPYVPSPRASLTGLNNLQGGLVFPGVDGRSRRQFAPQ